MRPGAENLSHLYIVLFLMFVRVCGFCMRVFNNHHLMWRGKEHKKTPEKNKTTTSLITTNMVGRRGDLSSPVVLCNESYLENHEEEKASETHRLGGKVTRVFLHITFVLISVVD